MVHDWGGPIGLRVTAENPERIARLVVMDTGVFTGHQKMSDAWKAFRDFVERTEDLPIGFLVKGACASEPPEEVIAAYEAPFPSPESKAGARAFPLMLATTPDAPGAAAGREALEKLQASSPPALLSGPTPIRSSRRRWGPGSPRRSAGPSPRSSRRRRTSSRRTRAR